MKIGILTYHRSYNYGAIFQAVAIRFVLQQLGHEVFYIDYFPDYHRMVYALPQISKRFCIRHPRAALYFYRDKSLKLWRKLKFEQFEKKYIYPYCSSIKDNYDLIIYGSDQIWRKQPYINAYNPFYFGKNELKAKKHIAYAASTDKIPDKEEDIKEFKQLLSYLDRISVRESDLLNSIREMGYYDAKCVLDPTLLLTCHQWDNVIPTKKKDDDNYILLYELQNAFDFDEVNQFAKEMGCTVKVIVGKAFYTKDKRFHTTCAPQEFIDYFRNAKYVFTSSFHGLAFSIIYHKEFYASFNVNSHRAVSLLKEIGCSNRLLLPKSKLPKEVDIINYEKVEKQLNVLRNISTVYLQENC